MACGTARETEVGIQRACKETDSERNRKWWTEGKKEEKGIRRERKKCSEWQNIKENKEMGAEEMMKSTSRDFGPNKALAATLTKMSMSQRCRNMDFGLSSQRKLLCPFTELSLSFNIKKPQNSGVSICIPASCGSGTKRILHTEWLGSLIIALSHMVLSRLQTSMPTEYLLAFVPIN